MKDAAGNERKGIDDVHLAMAERLRMAKTQSEIDQTGIDFYGYFADSVLATKDFEGCNRFLGAVNVQETSLQLLFSVAVASKGKSPVLTNREKLFSEVWEKYEHERGAAECYYTLEKLR